jgi:endonuclease/exonuclease/phosphatase family metal-dependent hydrolase
MSRLPGFHPLLLVACLLAGRAVFAAEPPALEVATFNIRYNNPADGPNAWPNRRELAAGIFEANGIDVAGLQEALIGQVRDLEQALPNFARLGVGRDDGKEAGEHNPIFYRKDRLEPESSGTFWLSATPEKPGSVGWDGACPRIATWAVFHDRVTGGRFLFVNTHLDHRGKRARLEASKLLVRRIATLGATLPVILTGDFNASVSDPELAPLLTSTATPLHVSGEENSPTETFNGFEARPERTVIDYILVGPGIDVGEYRVPHIVKDGVFISDHWPVMARLRLPH